MSLSSCKVHDGQLIEDMQFRHSPVAQTALTDDSHHMESEELISNFLPQTLSLVNGLLKVSMQSAVL